MTTIIKKTSLSEIYYINDDFDKSKETILFLHPDFSVSNRYNFEVPTFSGKYNTIAIDIMNDKITGAIGLSNTSNIINHILIDNEVKTIHLIGVAHGVIIAKNFLYEYPKKVITLISLD